MWHLLTTFQNLVSGFSGGYLSLDRSRASAWRERLARQLRSLGSTLQAHIGIVLFAVLVSTFVYSGFLLQNEARTSQLQARFFTGLAQDMTYSVASGSSSRILFPGTGPYNERLGYTRLPQLIPGLAGTDFDITRQVVVSPGFEEMVNRGSYPLYREKQQAGLTVYDRHGDTLYASRYPERVFAAYDSIPPLVIETLLFIENRTLLDPDHPYRNPAVEWTRLGRAVIDKTMNSLGSDRSVPGASTLATQLEKVRHSPEGYTSTATDKARQMFSASLRSYIDGPHTMHARKRIVTDYINSVPLAGIPPLGEVNGLGDGLWGWYGTELDEVSRLLNLAAGDLDQDSVDRQGFAYRQVLSLFLAHRRPSYYLAHPNGRRDLQSLTDEYLHALEAEGIIPNRLRDAALKAETRVRRYALDETTPFFLERKAANTARNELLHRFGMSSLYDLDRMDLTVRTTFDNRIQTAVTQLVGHLTDPSFVRENGLANHRLLQRGDPTRVNYAVVLFERGDDGNYVRLQTDNFDSPFDINRGSKLELGSTAKLRTLINYLQIVEELHQRYAELSSEELGAVVPHRGDRLSAWAVDYLLRNRQASAADMLRAAMNRRYSARTAERFFTGGGVHTFQNFDASHGAGSFSVAESFRHSINLPFIRMMRDIVHFYMHELPGSPADMLDDGEDSRRTEYLARFAHKEAGVFLNGFYNEYRAVPSGELLVRLADRHSRNIQRLVLAYRFVRPDADAGELAELIARYASGANVSAELVRAIHDRHDPAAFNWQDKGYLTGMHPLELWLIHYRLGKSDATRPQIMTASADITEEVYTWLLTSRNKQAQDQRIRTVLEEDAFEYVHSAWKEAGYPFARLVPSYATSIGTSADRPGALAELVGIILNDGILQPTHRIEELHFAIDTPYETLLSRRPASKQRIMSPEIASTVRGAMIDVVENGTARRAYRAIKDLDGSQMPIGAKTGTGDNRHNIYGGGGVRIASEPLNRTSTLVFFIGDRYYGTITAYVDGTESANYGFTSSLPAQILKMMDGPLKPLFEVASDEEETEARVVAAAASEEG